MLIKKYGWKIMNPIKFIVKINYQLWFKLKYIVGA